MWFAFPVALSIALASSVAAESFAGVAIYSGNDCSGTPLIVSVVDSTECEPVGCLFFIADAVTYSSATTCESTDREKFIADAYADASSSYVVVETFTRKCKQFKGASAYLATEECEVYDDTGANYFVASVNADGSASVGIYNDSSCTGTPFLGYTPDAKTVSSRSCYSNYTVIYTGTDNDGSTSSSSGSIAQVYGQDSTSSFHGPSGSRIPSSAGSFLGGSVGSSSGSSAHITDGSKSVGNTTVSESSGGVSTGALVGILVAYVLLSMAACVLCVDRLERILRQLGLRR